MRETIASDYNELTVIQQVAKKSSLQPITIVILHGWVVDSQIEVKWQKLIDLLRLNQFEVKFLRVPGLSAPLTETWSMTNYCDWLTSELSKIGDQPVILLGHSFGGHLAISFTHLYPEKIQALILIDSSGLRDHSWLANLKRTFFRSLAKVGKRITAQPNSQLAQKVLYKLAREHDYESASPVLRATMAKVVEHEVITEAKSVICPTLILWGEQDQITPQFIGQQLKALIPQSVLQIIPGARHSPPYTHAPEVAKNISDFVKNLNLGDEA